MVNLLDQVQRKVRILGIVLRQREEWIRFSHSNEDTKDEERRRGWVVDRRLNVVPSAKPVTTCAVTMPHSTEIIYRTQM